MDHTDPDPDYSALVRQLPTLRRYADVVPQLHQHRLTSGRGDTLDGIMRYFRQVRFVHAANRALMRRLVLFAQNVQAQVPPEEAVRLAWVEFPDPMPDRSARPF